MHPKPFNQVTFTLCSSGLWRLTMSGTINDVLLQDHLSTEMMDQERARLERAGFPVKVERLQGGGAE